MWKLFFVKTGFSGRDLEISIIIRNKTSPSSLVGGKRCLHAVASFQIERTTSMYVHTYITYMCVGKW